MSTVPCAAIASRRAAMFGVLPKTDVSERSPLPISPITAEPVCIPTRAAKPAPLTPTRSLRPSSDSRIVNAANTARVASSSCATG